MKILVLNGSPRANGHTAWMVDGFVKGAQESGHEVNVVSVCRKKINGCLACEYCHKAGNGTCIQKDDMQEIYPLLEEAQMIVLASPIYYHSFTGQLQCAINRIYALDKPKNLKKAALILSSGSDDWSYVKKSDKINRVFQVLRRADFQFRKFSSASSLDTGALFP